MARWGNRIVPRYVSKRYCYCLSGSIPVSDRLGCTRDFESAKFLANLQP